MSKPALTLYLAAPRGFCAGVDRAIKIVEMALEKRGAPVYVRHEIVHNKHVVQRFVEQGVTFVDAIDEVFGAGYAAQHPELVAAMLQTSAIERAVNSGRLSALEMRAALLSLKPRLF